MGDAPSPSVLYFDPKKSTENFARLCQFLVTICSDAMRDILSHFIKPSNLRPELDKNRSKLEKIMNVQEKHVLYPPHSSTSISHIRSRDLDLSLLYKILRNICNIPTHRAGWGNPPVPGDFSLAACIEGIRILRNSISGHSTNGTVDDVEFEDYYRELRRFVVEIEREVIGSDRYERGIDHLHDCDLNPTKSKEYVAQIRRNTGELIMKRERIDLVEEEANAKRVRLENLEESHAELKANQEQNHAELKAHQEQSHAELKAHQEQGHAELKAYLTEGLTAVKTDILKELKATKLQLQQERDTEKSLIQAGSETINGDTSTTTTTTTTTIKFKAAALENRNITHFSMHSTRENKCWLLVPITPLSLFASNAAAVSSKFYLLSEIGVSKEIKVPKEYDNWFFPTTITTNDDGEVVFGNGKSVVAARESGEFRKLFDISIFNRYTHITVCCLRSGNYLIKSLPTTDIIEYNREGVFLRMWSLPAVNTYSSRINQNNNLDHILTGSFSFPDRFHIFNKSFNLKRTVDIEDLGTITPVLNTDGDLLHGHGHSIDLLDDRGKFIKNVCVTRRHEEIMNIAYSNNGTIWILYDSAEIDIFKLEIDRC